MPTIAGYPARRTSITVADLQLQLFVVERLADYVDTTALLRDADAPEPPYWAHLWVGSRALARLVATEVACAGRRVIDVGCGLGLAGIVAAQRGARVVSFDTAPAALGFTHASAQLNGSDVLTVQTDLRQPGLRGRVDCVLAADVTYDPILQVALAVFLEAHLKPGAQAVCAESVRTIDTGFADACVCRGLTVTQRQVRELDDGRDTLVRVTHVGAPIDRR